MIICPICQNHWKNITYYDYNHCVCGNFKFYGEPINVKCYTIRIKLLDKIYLLHFNSLKNVSIMEEFKVVNDYQLYTEIYQTEFIPLDQFDISYFYRLAQLISFT